MNYWQLSRSPRYAILFATPLILMYEALAWLHKRTMDRMARDVEGTLAQ